MRPIQLADRFMTPLTLGCYEACGYRGVQPTSTVTLISHVVSKWGSKVVPLPPLRFTKHELDKDKQFSRAAVKRQDCAYLSALHPCNGEGIPLLDCVGGIPFLRKWLWQDHQQCFGPTLDVVWVECEPPCVVSLSTVSQQRL